METGEDLSAATKLLEAKWIDIVVLFTGGVSVVPIRLPAIGRHRPATTAHRAEERACEPPKLGFIYCSGVRVHGPSKKPINDLLPVGMPGGTNTSISDCELEA